MGRHLPFQNNRKLSIRDQEAHAERLAIVLESIGELGFMDAERIAHPASLRTRYSLVATAALNDDWESLWVWCLELCRREKAFLDALNPNRTWTKMPKQMTAYQVEGLQRCWDVGIALLDTGARLSEIVYLKWNQVDLKNDQIDLERGKTNSNSLIGITKRFKQV